MTERLLLPQRRFRSTVAWLSVPLWLTPLSWYLAYQPFLLISYVGVTLVGLQLGLVLFALGAAMMILASPVILLVRTQRRWTLKALVISILFLASFVGGMDLGQIVWRGRVMREVARGQPLVQSIHAFTTDNGKPPGSLQQLVPKYIPAVPRTGIGAFSEYRYVIGEPDKYDGNPWVLIISPPCPPLGFDKLMYFPQQNYPTHGYGGSVERVGSWAYVHE